MDGKQIPDWLLKALGVPPGTRRFILRAEVGRQVTLEIERYCNVARPKDGTTVEAFRLEQIDPPSDELKRAEPSADEMESCHDCVHWWPLTDKGKKKESHSGQCNAWGHYNFADDSRPRHFIRVHGHYIITNKADWCARYRRRGDPRSGLRVNGKAHPVTLEVAMIGGSCQARLAHQLAQLEAERREADQVDPGAGAPGSGPPGAQLEAGDQVDQLEARADSHEQPKRNGGNHGE